MVHVLFSNLGWGVDISCPSFSMMQCRLWLIVLFFDPPNGAWRVFLSHRSYSRLKGKFSPVVGSTKKCMLLPSCALTGIYRDRPVYTIVYWYTSLCDYARLVLAPWLVYIERDRSEEYFYNGQNNDNDSDIGLSGTTNDVICDLNNLSMQIEQQRKSIRSKRSSRQ